MFALLLTTVTVADTGTVAIPIAWIYGVLGAAAAALLVRATTYASPYIQAHFSSVWRLRRAEQALDEKSPGLWLAPSIPIEFPDGYERSIAKSKPIIVVANLKRGSGEDDNGCESHWSLWA